MSNRTGDTDGTDILWIALGGMFLLGSGAAAAAAASAVTAVQEALLRFGVLVPESEAAIAFGDSGVGVSLTVLLGAIGVLAAIVTLAAFRAARHRSED